MDVGSLFSTQCDAHNCSKLARFLCHRCGTFAFCSVKCRKRSHNFRKCTPYPTDEYLSTELVKASISLSVDEHKVHIELDTDIPYKNIGIFVLKLIDTLAINTQNYESELRSRTSFGLSRMRFEWHPDSWTKMALLYVTTFQDYTCIENLETVLSSCEYVIEKYHQAKRPPDNDYLTMLTILAMAYEQAVLQGHGNTQKAKKRMDALMNEASDLSEKLNHPDMTVQVRMARACMHRDLGCGSFPERMVAFIYSASELVSMAQDHNIACSIVLEICITAICLNDFTGIQMLCEFALDPTKDASRMFSQNLLNILLKFVSVNRPENAEVWARAFFQSTSIKENPVCTASAYLAMARVNIGDPVALKYFDISYKSYKKCEMPMHAADVAFDMFCECEESVKAIDCGRLFLRLISDIPFTELTGFSFAYEFNIVVQYLIRRAYVENRFDEAWRLAAMYCNTARFCDAWHAEELCHHRDLLVHMYMHKFSERSSMWPEWVNAHMRGMCAYRRLELPEYSRTHYFGSTQYAHDDFVDAIGLVDDQDEKSFALVWIQVEDFIYGFVVDTLGAIAVRCTPSNQGVESLVDSMAKSIRDDSERDISVAIIQHVDEPCDTLTRNLFDGVTGLWYA